MQKLASLWFSTRNLTATVSEDGCIHRITPVRQCDLSPRLLFRTYPIPCGSVQAGTDPGSCDEWPVESTGEKRNKKF
jgi:hypothetical protein